MLKSIMFSITLLWMPLIAHADLALGMVTTRLEGEDMKTWLIIDNENADLSDIAEFAQGSSSFGYLTITAMPAENLNPAENALTLEAMLEKEGGKIRAITPVVSVLPDGPSAPYWKSDEDSGSIDIKAFKVTISEGLLDITGTFTGTVYKVEMTDYGEQFFYEEPRKILGRFNATLPAE
ncbi:hypothetical protein [Celeribacter sp.]|uniref:hypothetical protein n=1 Tax=Celeribacter sp. TaxID=1890673 RepID=UPI003A935C12